jgi:hypothetical protein
VSSTATRVARFGPAAALVLIALWSTCRVLGARDQVPSDRDWTRAADRVRAEFHAGELIVFAPDWIDPVGRLHLGDLIPIAAAARLDGARFPVIWELSIRGASAPETRGLRPTAVQSFGGVTLRRFEQPAVTVVTDFAARIASAAVDGPRSRGPELVLAEVGFDPHRCAQVVPAPDGTVTMTFVGVALGSTLTIGAGLADVFTRRDVRDPGQLTVSIAEQPVATLRFGVDDGWVRTTIATTPGPATVTFAARALGPKANNRLICFAAEARQ